VDEAQARRILIDCDGVLTDGTLTIDSRGEKLFKRFHTRDVRAIRELVANGFEVTIVSADDWGGTEHFAEKVGAEFSCLRDKGQWPRDYIAVGDDSWDVPLLKGAVEAFCPHDADLSVKRVKGIHVIPVCGGRGVMAEVARRLLA
jgi:3-deoxy-D-manno-octulosonate 8-phosphate phosphatase KdsC-like HAD superfamily phosphatase